jgi:hypothetical protein
MLSTGLQCFLQGGNAFDSVGVPLYWVRWRSTGLECFRQSWKAFVLISNEFYRVGKHSTEF